MGKNLLIQSLSKRKKQAIETLWFDDRPRDNIQSSRVKARNEVGILFILNNLLVARCTVRKEQQRISERQTWNLVENLQKVVKIS